MHEQLCYSITVQFVGGPLDGHITTTALPQRSILAVKVPQVIPKGGLLLAALRRLVPWPRPRCFAQYELCRLRSEWRYRHVGSRFFNEDRLRKAGTLVASFDCGAALTERQD